MKLYTEEQVIIMLNRARLHKQDDTEMFTNEYLLSEETPIKLLSDEDAGVIALKIADTLKDKLTTEQEAYFVAGFQTYYKWMKEQILNQNK